MAEGVIAHEDVLCHVYAFLQAYGYSSALLALQNESRVPYNTIPVAADESGDGSAAERPTPAGLAAAVRSGAWDTVLSVYVDGLLLPDEVAFDLYECIVEELLVVRGFAHAARALFANSPVFASMRRTSAVRYARVQQMLDTHLATAGQAERGERPPLPPALHQRREALLSVLQEAITFDAEPYDGALPAALWQYLRGKSNGTGEAEARTRNDSIQTKRPRTESTEAPSPGLFIKYPLQCPKNICGKFAFADAELPVACASTMLERAEDGCSYAALIVGKTDGSIDFLDASAAAPVGPSVGHTDGVLSIALDAAAGEGAGAAVWLAAGYRDGWVKIYNTQSRKLVRRFAHVHAGGVTSVAFAGARSPALFGHTAWVVSGSFDGAIHVLDVHEGRALQQLRGAHQGKYVLSLCAVPGGVVSAGGNGALRFWAAAGGGLEPSGPARLLHDVCAPCRGDVPARLLPIAAARGADGGAEFVVLTRGRRVLVLAARFTGGAEAAVALRTSLVAPRPVHSGCLRVTRSPALSAPVLSLFLTDSEGTVLLYNIEMAWRAAGDSTGSRVELRPADETAVVVAECGRAVEDLCLVDVPAQRTTLLAYSPSLPTMYVLY